MEAVWRKMWADVTAHPSISALIVVTIVASSALLTLALATLMNLSAPYERSFDELNGAHLWLYLDRDLVRLRDVQRLEALSGVIGSTGLQHSLNARVRIRDTRVWVSLRVMPPEPPQVNRLLIQEGRYLLPHQAEVLAGKDLRDLYGLEVGDRVTVTRADGKKVELPVIGLAYNPMWDTYRNTQPPYLYVTEETMRSLFPNEETWAWSLGLRLAAPGSVDEVLALAEGLLRTDAIKGHTDWRDVRESAVFSAQLSFVLLGAFSFFAILATVLVIGSSIGSSVLAQFRQIGVLKAVGFTQRQIVLVYVGQYVVLALIGSPLGLALGVAASPLPLRSVAVSLSATFEPPLNLVLIGAVLVSIPSVVIAATLGAAYRGARANIIKAIAVGAEAPRRRPAWGVRLAERLGLPVVFVLGLQDVFSRPFRSFMTGLNLTLGVIGIVFGLTLNATVEAYRADPSLLGIVYDAAVTREVMTDARVRHLLSRAPGVVASYGERIVEAETQSGQSFQVRAVEGDLAAFPFHIACGRFFEPGDEEAIAGQGLLDWLGLKVGDEVTLILEDQERRPVTWRIVGQYAEPVNAGQMLMASLSTVRRTLRQAEATTYYLKLDPDASPAALRQYIAPRPDGDLNLTLVGQAIPSAVVYLQLAILALAGILIGIALINVFNTSLVAMRERTRSIGVLKTVGMTPVQVVAMVLTTAGVLGLLAVVAGIPLGVAFTRGVLAVLSRSYGFGEVSMAVSAPYIVLLVPLMVVVSMAGGLVPGLRAARLSIVEVLRHE